MEKDIEKALKQDYIEMMNDLANAPKSEMSWVAIYWCDENGHSEFMENMQKRMQEQARNYGKNSA